MGSPGANEGDTLANSSPTDPGPATGVGPTSQIEYDLLAWEAPTPSPVYVHTYARLEHGASNTGWFETVLVLGRVGARGAEEDPSRARGRHGAAALDRYRAHRVRQQGKPLKKYEPYFASDARLRRRAIARHANGYGQSFATTRLSA